MMRKNRETIKLAKVRKLIREAIRWYKLDNGMPEFYTNENWRYAKKADGRKRDYPYYVRSSKAIEDIAKKIKKIYDGAGKCLVFN